MLVCNFCYYQSNLCCALCGFVPIKCRLQPCKRYEKNVFSFFDTSCKLLSSSCFHFPHALAGDKPISRVPPSCFAMANKSPFSRGFGSLQICSVHQRIPSGPKHDFWLAGLRQDAATARAPGVFRELPASIGGESDLDSDQWAAGRRLPGRRYLSLFVSCLMRPIRCYSHIVTINSMTRIRA